MSKEDYEKYLQSEHWKETREKRLEIDGHRCYLCGHKKKLNVHHLRYNNLGHEDVENDLITLCHRCHGMIHRIIDSSKAEYDRLREEHDKKLFVSFKKTVRDSIIKELWIRDYSFGGDLNIFHDNLRTVNKMMKIVNIIYPDIGEIHVQREIAKKVKKVSVALFKDDTNKNKAKKKRKNRNKKKKLQR